MQRLIYVITYIIFALLITIHISVAQDETPTAILTATLTPTTTLSPTIPSATPVPTEVPTETSTPIILSDTPTPTFTATTTQIPSDTLTSEPTILASVSPTATTVVVPVTATQTESPINPTATDIGSTATPILETPSGTSGTVEITVTATQTIMSTVTPTNTVFPTPIIAVSSTASPSPTATITSTPTNVPFTSEPPLSVLVTDDFELNELLFWNSNPSWTFITTADGQALQSNNGVEPLVFTQTNMDDVAAELQMQLNNGSARLSLRESRVDRYSVVVNANGIIALYRNDALLEGTTVEALGSDWHTVKLSAINDIIRVYIDSALAIAYQDSIPLSAGGLSIASVDGSPLQIDNFTLSVPTDEPTPTPEATAIIEPQYIAVNLFQPIQWQTPILSLQSQTLSLQNETITELTFYEGYDNEPLPPNTVDLETSEYAYPIDIGIAYFPQPDDTGNAYYARLTSNQNDVLELSIDAILDSESGNTYHVTALNWRRVGWFLQFFELGYGWHEEEYIQYAELKDNAGNILYTTQSCVFELGPVDEPVDPSQCAEMWEDIYNLDVDGVARVTIVFKSVGPITSYTQSSFVTYKQIGLDDITVVTTVYDSGEPYQLPEDDWITYSVESTNTIYIFDGYQTISLIEAGAGFAAGLTYIAKPLWSPDQYLLAFECSTQPIVSDPVTDICVAEVDDDLQITNITNLTNTLDRFERLGGWDPSSYLLGFTSLEQVGTTSNSIPIYDGVFKTIDVYYGEIEDIGIEIPEGHRLTSAYQASTGEGNTGFGQNYLYYTLEAIDKDADLTEQWGVYRREILYYDPFTLDFEENIVDPSYFDYFPETDPSLPAYNDPPPLITLDDVRVDSYYNENLIIDLIRFESGNPVPQKYLYESGYMVQFPYISNPVTSYDARIPMSLNPYNETIYMKRDGSFASVVDVGILDSANPPYELNLGTSYADNDNFYVDHINSMRSLGAAETDLGVSISASDPLIGELTYTVQLTNYGPNLATNIYVNGILPFDYDYYDVDELRGSYDPLIGEWYLESLAVNETQTLIISVFYDPLVPDTTYTNTIMPFDQTDLNPLNDSASISLGVDLGLSMSVADPVGNIFTYTVELTNYGPNDASNVTIYGDLPFEILSYDSHVFDDLRGYYDPYFLEWYVESIAVGETLTLQLSYVNATSSSVTFSNTIFQLDQADLNPANDVASVTVSSELSVSLTLDASVDPDAIFVGDTIPIIASVSNTGFVSTNGNVILSIAVPNGLAPNQVTVENQVFDILSHILYWLGLGPEPPALPDEIRFISGTENSSIVEYDIGVIEGNSQNEFLLNMTLNANLAGDYIITGSLGIEQPMQALSLASSSTTQQLLTQPQQQQQSDPTPEPEDELTIVVTSTPFVQICTGVVNANPDFGVRDLPNLSGFELTRLNNDTPIPEILGIAKDNVGKTWYRVKYNGNALGWMRNEGVKINGDCDLSLLEADGTVRPDATYDYILPEPDPIWISLPCSDTASEDEVERNNNFRRCAKIVYSTYYFEFLDINDRPPKMSDLLATVYRNELSVVINETVGIGINRSAGIPVAEVAAEALRSNYWSVIYSGNMQGGDCVVEGELKLSLNGIGDCYLYQVQSFYQKSVNALAPQGSDTRNKLRRELILKSGTFLTFGYEALLQQWQITENETIIQWGNYGYDDPDREYDTLYTNLSVDYCYTVRVFTDKDNDLTKATHPPDEWNDYRFVFISARSLGSTSTYDYLENPNWLEKTIINENTGEITGFYRNTINGTVFLDCSEQPERE